MTFCSRLFIGSIAAMLVALLSASALAQGKETQGKETQGKETQGKETQAPDAEALAKLFADFAKLAPEHKHLKKYVGRWKTVARSYSTDPENPSTSEGTAVFRMILGGRFCQQQFRGELEGQKFEGFGLTGYDKVKKKYVGVWADSMGTSIMPTEGTMDKAGTLTEIGQAPTPVGSFKMRNVTSFDGDDKFTMTMYMTGPDGKEAKAMDFVYTRLPKRRQGAAK